MFSQNTVQIFQVVHDQRWLTTSASKAILNYDQGDHHSSNNADNNAQDNCDNSRHYTRNVPIFGCLGCTLRTLPVSTVPSRIHLFSVRGVRKGGEGEEEKKGRRGGGGQRGKR